jgi:2,4-dienoyl-CoA reductase-like NADH-dependent reductase (Old Yellow Enzyme family)
MATLFEATAINGMYLKNRLVRSATWEGMCADDGRPTDNLLKCYRELALGGVGLIVSGFAFVRPDGKQMPGKMGIHDDAFRANYEALTAAVHGADGKIAVQLVHAGGQAGSAVAGRQPLAPSAVKVAQFSEEPAELHPDDINAIVAAFAAGARRARAWGFDAVQLHGAHGYLINQFLSPLTNRRTDDYGGGVANRCRFLREVYQAVRAEVGEEYPVMIKLNAADNLEGGLEVEDAIAAAQMLDALGIDAIEVSAGTPASGGRSPARLKINAPEKEAYHLNLAGRIKAAVRCPVMVVGGFRSFEVAARAVSPGGVDHVALSRPLIREPALPARWQAGDHTAARCISCNGCFKPGLEEGGIYCIVARKEAQESTRSKGETD